MAREQSPGPSPRGHPTSLGGTDLPAGTPLLLLFGSGNRDETKFPHPDEVDLDRRNVREHLARPAAACTSAQAP